MSHKILWTRSMLDEFVQEAILTKDEEFIVRTRAEGWSRQQQAFELNRSVQSIDRMIKKIKVKYDNIAKHKERSPAR